ncbi:MAG TPA: TlpA disulfide reductase family protein [Candidatus Nitrosotalea sp.]|nr:TlpA disulfide reductase family protein [Candidatus Nitrosotalea sp.]
MSRAFLGIAAFAAFALAVARSPATGLGDAVGVGQSAPNFLIDTVDGASVTSNFHGRPAYINIFTTWCSPCRRELPSIVAQAKTYGDRIVFLLVDEQEPPNRVKSFASTFGILTPVAIDRGEIAAAFNVPGFPESIFINRRGVVQYIYLGAVPANVLGEQLSKLASS